MIENQLCTLSVKLDIYSSSYNNFIILGDFSIEMEEQQIKTFCKNYGLKSVLKRPTCYKSST